MGRGLGGSGVGGRGSGVGGRGGGGWRILVLSRLNLPDISPLGSVRSPPHWQLIGSQFSIVSPLHSFDDD